MDGAKEFKENKMGVKPVKRLLVGMSLPMMASMLMQALYNIVDSIFVTRLSEDALTAVSLAFPMQNIMIAVASGTGVGVNALLSKALGEKNQNRADAAANAGILLSALSSAVMLIVGMFLSEPFLRSQTDIPGIVSMGTDYIRIVCCLSFGLFMQVMCERLLQSTGRTLFSMASQITGAVINIILDPIMILGSAYIPFVGYIDIPWINGVGVAGAAYATVIGQFCAAAVAMLLNVFKNPEIKIRLRDILRPHAAIIKRIYAVGIPSILMMSIGSVMTYLMNRILIGFSTTAAAVFGVYFKLQSFFFMPVFGLNNGLIPILAYNYGARRKDRITEVLRFGMLLAFCIMAVGTVIFNVFPGVLLDFFNASPYMHEIGEPALRIISFCFPIAAVCIALGSTFQAFSQSIYSLIVSVIRQLVVLIPSAWLLARTGEVTSVWWSFIIAEGAGLIITVICFRHLYRKTRLVL